MKRKKNAAPRQWRPEERRVYTKKRRRGNSKNERKGTHRIRAKPKHFTQGNGERLCRGGEQERGRKRDNGKVPLQPKKTSYQGTN